VDDAVGSQHRVRPRDHRGAHQHPLVPVCGAPGALRRA
jgi:hypothetical protein